MSPRTEGRDEVAADNIHKEPLDALMDDLVPMLRTARKLGWDFTLKTECAPGVDRVTLVLARTEPAKPEEEGGER
jgi:hypothetical protein